MRRLILIVIAVLIHLPATLTAADPADATRHELHVPRKDPDVDKLGVLESYKEAVELEKEIAQIYREIRAAKLSQIQRQSMKKSLRQTLLPISNRLTPDNTVFEGKANNGEDVKKYQDKLKEVMQENDAIVANAEEMLQSLMPEKKEDEQEKRSEALAELLEQMDEKSKPDAQEKAPLSEPQTDEMMKQQVEELNKKAQEQIDKTKDSLADALQEMKQAEAMIKKTVEAAKNDEKSEPKDSVSQKLAKAQKSVETAIDSITEKKEDINEKVEQARKAMEAIAAALTETSEVDKQLAESKQHEPQEHTAEAVKKLETASKEMESAAKAILMASALSDARHGTLSKDQQIAQQQVLGVLARAEAGQYLDLTKQMKGHNLHVRPEAVNPEDYPTSIRKHFKNIPGRKVVTVGGTPAVWFHVNQWYILGPYDNRGRMNIQRVYPPESIIDLDANYMGKNNAKLAWVYDSFVEPVVTPINGWGEYSIYYGFTELYFEEESDLWIAVGSDDRSDLWINDMPVWHSSNQLKGWRIDEGFRKVHFKKGANKIVFRLENGWKQMGFSLLINTHQPSK